MKKQLILCHRGMWTFKKDQNTKSALLRPLTEGYGIETDLRSHNGAIVLSHDPVETDHSYNNKVVEIEWLFEVVNKQGFPGALALNIKECDLQEQLKKMLTKYKINNYFLFDMAIPDHLKYTQLKLKQFARFSLYEDPEKVKKFSEGLWVDGFNKTAKTIKSAAKILDGWNNIAFVSPELHDEDSRTGWELISKLQTHDKQIMICTDKPHDTYEFFKEWQGED